MKYNIGDNIFYLNGNKITNGIIVATRETNYILNIEKYLSMASESWLRDSFKNDIAKYAISLNNFNYIILEERQIFLSKEALIEYIQREE